MIRFPLERERAFKHFSEPDPELDPELELQLESHWQASFKGNVMAWASSPRLPLLLRPPAQT